MNELPFIVLDNGGESIRATLFRRNSNKRITIEKSILFPNCTIASVSGGVKGPSGSSSSSQLLVGPDILKLRKYDGLVARRPVDRGFIVEVQLQARIWERLLHEFEIIDESTALSEVIVSVPFGAPRLVLEAMYYLCFHVFKFKRVGFVSPQLLALHGIAVSNSPKPSSSSSSTSSSPSRVFCGGATSFCGVLVDSGFSSTTVVPYWHGAPIRTLIRRVDVGGKVLTNRLKEIISFKQINMLEETWIVNHVKEAVLFVARNFRHEIWKATHGRSASVDGTAVAPATTSSTAPSSSRLHHRPNRKGSIAGGKLYRREIEASYLLPTVAGVAPGGLLLNDTRRRKQVVEEEENVEAAASAAKLDGAQQVVLSHERFVVAESLFCPSDLGLNQVGVSDLVASVFHAVRHTDVLDRKRIIIAQTNTPKKAAANNSRAQKNTNRSQVSSTWSNNNTDKNNSKKRRTEKPVAHIDDDHDGDVDDSGEKDRLLASSDEYRRACVAAARRANARLLMRNVVLCGGSSAIDGFKERLLCDLLARSEREEGEADETEEADKDEPEVRIHMFQGLGTLSDAMRNDKERGGKEQRRNATTAQDGDFATAFLSVVTNGYHKIVWMEPISTGDAGMRGWTKRARGVFDAYIETLMSRISEGLS